ncbi:MAG TPA: hypothetical protein VII06_32880 [Chloroflexota bacterium]|jgi:hypothetical protein
MTAFDVAILMGALCGFSMVAGSLVLLARQTITLTHRRDNGGRGPGISVNFQGLKDFSLNTDYPAVALFVIGLLFVVCAIWASRPEQIGVQFRAQLDGDDPWDASVYVAIPLTKVETESDGRSIDFTVYHNAEPVILTAMICVPTVGCQDVAGRVTRTLPLAGSDTGRSVDLKLLHLPAAKTKPEVNPANIETPRASLPPVSASGSY